mmetsp:Transcript_125117/g.348161  ORF Transcript_125117/g.348161 Transcript_125117/m.348161 type:complete len:351 (+) Transcript_125117:195-1247(+)
MSSASASPPAARGRRRPSPSPSSPPARERKKKKKKQKRPKESKEPKESKKLKTKSKREHRERDPDQKRHRKPSLSDGLRGSSSGSAPPQRLKAVVQEEQEQPCFEASGLLAAEERRTPSPPSPCRPAPLQPPKPLLGTAPPSRVAGSGLERRSRSRDERGAGPGWGSMSSKGKGKGKSGQEEEVAPKEQPNFEASGLLAVEDNSKNGIPLKFVQPPEARMPTMKWRMYIFAKQCEAPKVMHLHRFVGYLFGKDRRVADVPTDHPTCSKQHAVLHYRLCATGEVKPYIMDLESTNGTFLNGERIEPARYFEMKERDVLKFGMSSREFVLLHAGSANDMPIDPKRLQSDPED